MNELSVQVGFKIGESTTLKNQTSSVEKIEEDVNGSAKIGKS